MWSGWFIPETMRQDAGLLGLWRCRDAILYMPSALPAASYHGQIGTDTIPSLAPSPPRLNILKFRVSHYLVAPVRGVCIIVSEIPVTEVAMQKSWCLLGLVFCLCLVRPVLAQEPEGEKPPEQEEQAAAPVEEAAPELKEVVPEIPEHEPTRLSQIVKIYIDEMPNDLHTYIQAEMVKKFKGRIRPVMTPEQADAILAGTGDHRKGTGAAITGRWLGLHDTATGAVTLLDRYGDHIIWADEAGDRSLFFGVFMRGGPRKVASRLMKHLDKAIREDKKGKFNR